MSARDATKRRAVVLDMASLKQSSWRILSGTVASCMRYRVTGLAAEAAFFAVLSLPPLIFALAGSIGFVVAHFSHTQVSDLRQNVLDAASKALTPETVDTVIRPTLDEVLKGGRYDVISIGFVLALWSGSRALNVFVDTITIMYGLAGKRGIIWTRALSFLLFILGLITGVVAIPLVLAGPDLVTRWVPHRVEWIAQMYWPIVLIAGVCFLATLYHVSVPVRTKWRYNLPGAVFTMVCWIFGSALLRTVLLAVANNSTSIYGPLAAPIAVLLWLYVLSISVLIGAALNATIDDVWPQVEVAEARSTLRDLLGSSQEQAVEPENPATEEPGDT